MKGQLSEHPLAELIREITSGGLSGALRLARGRVKAVAYALGGEVVRARSNLRVHHLIECARRAGHDADGRLSAVVTEMMGEAEAEAALVASGAIDQAAMQGLRAIQTADVLRPFLLWTDGEWDFDPRARSTGQTGARIDIKQLLLEGAQHLPTPFAAARLAGYDETISPTGVPPPPSLHLRPVEGYILSRVDVPLKLGELMAVAGLPEPQTRHGVYALALCGLLARERWPLALAGAEAAPEAPAADDAPPAAARGGDEIAAAAAAPEKSAPEPADPRAELEELLERVGGEADYFEILGVGRVARPADVKRAYYALAKRFHPDRFRQIITGDEERTRVEHAFAQVTKAYETLHDARSRDTYLSKLPPKSAAKPAAAAAGVFGKRKEAATAKVAARADAVKVQADPTATPQYRAEESYQQGLSAAERGDQAAAQAYFGEAVRLAPQEARYHALYGRALALAPATRRQAEGELQRAVKLDPRNVTYYVALAELYRAVGLRRRAEGELSRALSLDPDHAPARRMLEQMKGNDDG